jgi:hypothetical protein
MPLKRNKTKKRPTVPGWLPRADEWVTTGWINTVNAVARALSAGGLTVYLVCAWFMRYTTQMASPVCEGLLLGQSSPLKNGSWFARHLAKLPSLTCGPDDCVLWRVVGGMLGWLLGWMLATQLQAQTALELATEGAAVMAILSLFEIAVDVIQLVRHVRTLLVVERQTTPSKTVDVATRSKTADVAHQV